MAGVTIACMGVSAHYQGKLIGLGDINLVLFSILFAAIMITAFCNACDMVDRVDGLAGILTLVPIWSLLQKTVDSASDTEVAPISVPYHLYRRILDVESKY